MSTSNLNAKAVIVACEKYLSHRETLIQNRREKYIEKQMKKWFFPSKTREEAIRYLQKPEEYGSVWERATLYGSYNAMRVELMLRLAEASDTFIVVYDDEFDIIYPFFKQ